MCNRRKLARRTAFTLIELMIVVAIIAVLIAILLPSLNRARQQAYQVKCAANLRGIGVGILYYVNDHNGYLPDMGTLSRPSSWAVGIFPYLKIKRSKVGVRNGFLQCPADDTPPYRFITGPRAGEKATVYEKLRADSGESLGDATRRRGGAGGAGGAEPQVLGPLIEPVTYVGARGHLWSRKLIELDRPFCQALLCEDCDHPGDCFEPGLEDQGAWRHYGGTNPNSNGSNWLFADGHVQWHSVTSIDKLLCCQDFGFLGVQWSRQKQKCASTNDEGETTRRR